MDIKFSTNRDDFYNDYMDVVRLFYPYIVDSEDGELFELYLDEFSNNSFICIINSSRIKGKSSTYYINLEENISYLEKKSLLKRFSKVHLYDHLVEISNHKLPYGSLTGIRPTKLYHQLKSEGKDAYNYFINELRVSKEKTDLISKICTNQEKYNSNNLNEIDLFVNIPICVSRCSYCSFLSAEMRYVKDKVQPYCDLLVKDIINAKNLIKELNFKVRSIYIGGGTPTSFNVNQLGSVLKELSTINCKEFTVEAGRPDTINYDKLSVMKSNGVSRISINPQTFNQSTLNLVGRKHTVEDIYEKYDMAKKFDFDINMDLIAMLPNETLNDFKHSVDCAIDLDPTNITVHTLAIKRGSDLKLSNYENCTEEQKAISMLNYSYDKIMNHEYQPYYMYKQKYSSFTLENIGYSRPSKECIYNIDIMEEVKTILACGAGGISKVLFNEGKTLDRLPNPKGLDVYLNRGNDNFVKREVFFKSKIKI